MFCSIILENEQKFIKFSFQNIFAYSKKHSYIQIKLECLHFQILFRILKIVHFFQKNVLDFQKLFDISKNVYTNVKYLLEFQKLNVPLRNIKLDI